MSIQKLLFVVLASFSSMSQAAEILAKETVCAPGEFGPQCIQLQASGKLKIKKKNKIKEKKVEEGRVVTRVYTEHASYQPASQQEQVTATASEEE